MTIAADMLRLNENVNAYADLGYVILRGLVDPPALKALGDRLDAAARGDLHPKVGRQTEPELQERAIQTNDPTAAVRKVWNLARYDEIFRAFVSDERFVRLAERLVGPPVKYLGDEAQLKPAQWGSAHPWHQDAPYFHDFHREFVTFWIAVDRATKLNGCMEVIPGSNRRGVLSLPERGRDWFKDGELDLSGAVPAEIEPGDALVFHSCTLHGSGPNRSDFRRRSMIFRFVNAAGMLDAEWERLNRYGVLLDDPDAHAMFRRS